MGRRAVAWIAPIAWASMIFVLSAQPDLRVAPDPATDLILRKIGHAMVFGILAVLVAGGLRSARPDRDPWVWAVLISVAYACLDELHQGLVPGRYAALLDVAIDSSGIVLAWALARTLSGRFAVGSRRGSRGHPPRP